jgi:hypothetical protein
MRASLNLLAASSVLVVAAACSDAPPAPSPVTTTAPPTMMSPSPPPPPPVPDMARYEVRFESTWSPVTHPTDFPSDAHYSPLIGGTHNADVAFWREGQPASDGIQAMAERGRTSPLDTEVTQAMAGGQAQYVLRGEALDDSPGSLTLEFDITRAFPLVTLVTMVAPSPDWFVGVGGLPLFADGDWVDEVTVELFVFDAGTDSGPTFRSPDEPTQPKGVITRIAGYPIADGAPPVPFGRMVFKRQ